MTPTPPSDVVAQARALVEDGRSWQARDLLTAHVETERDVEALTLLGHVHQGMGDLPRAGAAWFAAGVRGPEADEAVVAWRERSHDDFGVMWRSLPPSFQAEPRPARIEALRARALRVGSGEPEAPATDDRAHTEGRTSAGDAEAPEEDGGGDDGGTDAAQVVGWIVAAVFVFCAVVGFVTVLGWMVPG